MRGRQAKNISNINFSRDNAGTLPVNMPNTKKRKRKVLDDSEIKKEVKEKKVRKEIKVPKIVKQYNWPIHPKWFYVKDNVNSKKYQEIYKYKLRTKKNYSIYIKWSHNYIVAKLMYTRNGEKFPIAFTKGKIKTVETKDGLEKILYCDGVKGVKGEGYHLSVVQWPLHLFYDAYIQPFRKGIKADKLYIPNITTMIKRANKENIGFDNSFYDRMRRNYEEIPKAMGFTEQVDGHWVMGREEAKKVIIKYIDLKKIKCINTHNLV